EDVAVEKLPGKPVKRASLGRLMQQGVAVVRLAQDQLGGQETGRQLAERGRRRGQMQRSVTAVRARQEIVARDQGRGQLVQPAAAGGEVNGRVAGVVLKEQGLGCQQGRRNLAEAPVLGRQVERRVARRIRLREAGQRESVGWQLREIALAGGGVK